MMNNLKLREEFLELFYMLDEEIILDMSKKNGGTEINNVVVGLREECFGILLIEDSNKFSYQLLYVNGKENLTGFLLNIDLDNPNRDDLVFMFSNHLSHKFNGLDLVDTFNSFQTQTRQLLEKEGYFTVTSLDMNKFEGMNSTIISKGHKEIILISMIDKIQFFQEYFGKSLKPENSSKENHIYLMLNMRNGLMKIGRSINPKFREKTLQSQEPEIAILSVWAAPREVERELHKMFRDKKERGEWFNLKSIDLKRIKEKMACYE